jgi:hypothetical protein
MAPLSLKREILKIFAHIQFDCLCLQTVSMGENYDIIPVGLFKQKCLEIIETAARTHYTPARGACWWMKNHFFNQLLISQVGLDHDHPGHTRCCLVKR